MKCVVCTQEITPDRAEALEVMEVNPAMRTCLSCAPNQKVKGVFSGEAGTSRLIVASAIGGDKVEWEKE